MSKYHEGYIITDESTIYAEVNGQKIRCPACNKPFERWPLGWDAHAASSEKCIGVIKGENEEERKAEFKKRFTNLFNPKRRGK